MAFETSTLTILFLIIIILVLVFVVVCLNIEYYKEKKASKKKIHSLRTVFVQTKKKKKNQLDKIKLSEEAKGTIKTMNATLSTDIVDLNRELFEIVYKNNLA